jgi:hypothetical protein
MVNDTTSALDNQSTAKTRSIGRSANQAINTSNVGLLGTSARALCIHQGITQPATTPPGLMEDRASTPLSLPSFPVMACASFPPNQTQQVQDTAALGPGFEFRLTVTVYVP